MRGRTAYLAWLALGLTACPKTDSSSTSTTTTAVDAAAASSATTVASASTGDNAVLAPLDMGGGTAPTTTAQPVPHPLVPTASTAPKLLPGPTTTSTAVATSAAAPTHTAATAAPLQACCSALHRQSQQGSPQAAQYAQAAMLCDGLASAMANTGSAPPQIEQIKPLLQGAQLPPLCQGL